MISALPFVARSSVWTILNQHFWSGFTLRSTSTILIFDQLCGQVLIQNIFAPNLSLEHNIHKLRNHPWRYRIRRSEGGFVMDHDIVTCIGLVLIPVGWSKVQIQLNCWSDRMQRIVIGRKSFPLMISAVLNQFTEVYAQVLRPISNVRGILFWKDEPWKDVGYRERNRVQRGRVGNMNMDNGERIEAGGSRESKHLLMVGGELEKKMNSDCSSGRV
jgi:hypothetical protein